MIYNKWNKCMMHCIIIYSKVNNFINMLWDTVFSKKKKNKTAIGVHGLGPQKLSMDLGPQKLSLDLVQKRGPWS